MPVPDSRADLTLRLWAHDDLPLLHAANTPAMTAHLNGPESDDEILARHERYLRLVDAGEARMFVIEDAAGRALGSIGHWKVDWRAEPAWETGWFVLPAAQGRGVAAQALTLLIADLRLRAEGRRHLVAFPGASNAASNAVCRRAGLALVGTVSEDFRGATLTVNEWALDLTAAADGAGDA